MWRMRSYNNTNTFRYTNMAPDICAIVKTCRCEREWYYHIKFCNIFSELKLKHCKIEVICD